MQLRHSSKLAMHACMYVCMYVRVIIKNIHIYIHTHNTNIQYTYIYIYVSIYTYKYIYIQIYIYIHIQPKLLRNTWSHPSNRTGHTIMRRSSQSTRDSSRLRGWARAKTCSCNESACMQVSSTRHCRAKNGRSKNRGHTAQKMSDIGPNPEDPKYGLFACLRASDQAICGPTGKRKA